MHLTPGQFPAPANLINHTAKAYGIARPAPVAQPQPAAPLSFTIKPDVYEPTPAQQLVAGSVAGSVSFDGSPRAAAPLNAYAFQMYTRAADKVEAAVGVQVGRTLDVSG